MQVALVSYAFIDSECFTPAGGLPWSLCHGNIERNLEELASSPNRPEDPTAFKIQVMLRQGSNRQELVSAIRLLRECPWSTNTAEQQHASVSLVHRMHPSTELSTLLRAGIHSMRRLIPAMDPGEKL
eukprot:9083064-Lingulodinium_polyedra.AAC.1